MTADYFGIDGPTPVEIARSERDLPPVGRPFHGDLEPVPMTEEARSLTGMARYLSPDWDIPTCPVIGKGLNDHCKHGIGNLDYCPHCEHENDDLSFADMEI